jgi:hypothetical protein
MQERNRWGGEGEYINLLTLFYLSQVVYDLIDFNILYLKIYFLKTTYGEFLHKLSCTILLYTYCISCEYG